MRFAISVKSDSSMFRIPKTNPALRKTAIAASNAATDWSHRTLRCGRGSSIPWTASPTSWAIRGKKPASGGVPARVWAVELSRPVFQRHRRAASVLRQSEMDTDQFDAKAWKLHEPQFRIRNVRPGAKRHLQQIGGLQAGNPSSPGEEPADQLDVECPAGMEWLVERCSEQTRGAERLGAALGIVDAQIEDQRCSRGEDAAEVVSESVALDVGAEERDARCKRRLRVGGAKGGDEADHLLRRRRQVGVEEPDVLCAHPHSREKPLPDGLRLSLVSGQIEAQGVRTEFRADRLEDLAGIIFRAVVHEQQSGIRVLHQDAKSIRAQTPSLVEARHDNDKLDHLYLRDACTMSSRVARQSAH